MGKAKDLTGQKFGRLTVIRRTEDYVSPKGCHIVRWLCKCDCGNEVITRSDALTSDVTMSCGCYHKEKVSKSQKGKRKVFNTYDLSGEYGIGYTSKGEEFYFDLEDYDKIKDYYWYVDGQNYIVACDINRGRNYHLRLHRLVMNCLDDNFDVDHIHGDATRFDNRKSNLRICTHQENIRNCKVSKNNTSGVAGISWDKKSQKWFAYIWIDYKRISLGYHNNFEDAVKVRKEAEEKYFGEFSYDKSQSYTVK